MKRMEHEKEGCAPFKIAVRTMCVASGLHLSQEVVLLLLLEVLIHVRRDDLVFRCVTNLLLWDLNNN